MLLFRYVYNSKVRFQEDLIFLYLACKLSMNQKPEKNIHKYTILLGN